VNKIFGLAFLSTWKWAELNAVLKSIRFFPEMNLEKLVKNDASSEETCVN
jgi:hypothetical protein